MQVFLRMNVRRFACVMVVFLFTATAVLTSVSALADVRGMFASDNSVRNIFHDRAQVLRSPVEVGYFPDRTPKDEEYAVEQSEQDQIKEIQEQVKKEALPSRDEIVEAFGDPSADDPLLGVEDAPPSFRAIHHALEIGDERLAFSYARKYVRRLRNVRSRSKGILAMVAKAMEREGEADGEGWTAQYPQYEHLLQEDLEESMDAESAGALDHLDERTRRLIEMAEAEEADAQERAELADMAKEKESNVSALSDLDQRREIRTRLIGRVPVDTQGLVRIQFFMRPKDKQSKLMGAALESIYQRSLKDPRIEFSAYTIDVTSPAELYSYQKRTGTTFTIMDGTKLAKVLQIKKAPTTVFFAPSVAGQVIEEGARNVLFLNELVSAMQGSHRTPTEKLAATDKKLQGGNR